MLEFLPVGGCVVNLDQYFTVIPVKSAVTLVWKPSCVGVWGRYAQGRWVHAAYHMFVFRCGWSWNVCVGILWVISTFVWLEIDASIMLGVISTFSLFLPLDRDGMYGILAGKFLRLELWPEVSCMDPRSLLSFSWVVSPLICRRIALNYVQTIFPRLTSYTLVERGAKMVAASPLS